MTRVGLIVINHPHHISFLLNRFSVKYRFTIQILWVLFFSIKSPSVIQRSISIEKTKSLSLFLKQN